MSEFETMLACLLIPVAYVLAYWAGRMNLLELMLEMAEERIKELKDKREAEDGFRK